MALPSIRDLINLLSRGPTKSSDWPPSRIRRWRCRSCNKEGYVLVMADDDEATQAWRMRQAHTCGSPMTLLE